MQFPINTHIPILRRFWDIARYWSNISDLNLPHLYLALPVEFRQDLWHQIITVPGLSYGLVSIIIRSSVLIQYWSVTNGEMDRQMHDSLCHASIASRGKNVSSIRLLAWYLVTACTLASLICMCQHALLSAVAASAINCCDAENSCCLIVSQAINYLLISW